MIAQPIGRSSQIRYTNNFQPAKSNFEISLRNMPSEQSLKENTLPFEYDKTTVRNFFPETWIWDIEIAE